MSKSIQSKLNELNVIKRKYFKDTIPFSIKLFIFCSSSELWGDGEEEGAIGASIQKHGVLSWEGEDQSFHYDDTISFRCPLTSEISLRS